MREAMFGKTNERPKTRIQFDMYTDRLAELDARMRELGIETRKEYFDNGLTILEWAVGVIQKGKIVASVDEVTAIYNELILPAFKNVRRTLSIPDSGSGSDDQKHVKVVEYDPAEKESVGFKEFTQALGDGWKIVCGPTPVAWKPGVQNTVDSDSSTTVASMMQVLLMKR